MSIKTEPDSTFNSRSHSSFADRSNYGDGQYEQNTFYTAFRSHGKQRGFRGRGNPYQNSQSLRNNNRGSYRGNNNSGFRQRSESSNYNDRRKNASGSKEYRNRENLKDPTTGEAMTYNICCSRLHFYRYCPNRNAVTMLQSAVASHQRNISNIDDEYESIMFVDQATNRAIIDTGATLCILDVYFSNWVA